MKKFGLYSWTCHGSASVHTGPLTSHAFGRTPGSTNALSGWAGPVGVGAFTLSARAASSSAFSAGVVFAAGISAMRLAGMRHTFDQRPFDSHTEPCRTRIASPPGP